MPDISDILIARVIFLILASNVYYGSGHGNNKTIPPKKYKHEKTRAIFQIQIYEKTSEKEELHLQLERWC